MSVCYDWKLCHQKKTTLHTSSLFLERWKVLDWLFFQTAELGSSKASGSPMHCCEGCICHRLFPEHQTFRSGNTELQWNIWMHTWFSVLVLFFWGPWFKNADKFLVAPKVNFSIHTSTLRAFSLIFHVVTTAAIEQQTLSIMSFSSLGFPSQFLKMEHLLIGTPYYCFQ